MLSISSLPTLITSFLLEFLSDRQPPPPLRLDGKHLDHLLPLFPLPDIAFFFQISRRGCGERQWLMRPRDGDLATFVAGFVFAAGAVDDLSDVDDGELPCSFLLDLDLRLTYLYRCLLVVVAFRIGRGRGGGVLSVLGFFLDWGYATQYL